MNFDSSEVKRRGKLKERPTISQRDFSSVENRIIKSKNYENNFQKKAKVILSDFNILEFEEGN